MSAIFGIVLALIAAVLRLVHARPGLVLWLIIAAVILIGIEAARTRPLALPWRRSQQ